jgi:hypothetical protein
MPDLETLLRDVRPVPEPAWAARLDARAAAGFPGPPPRWKAPLIALRDHILALGAVGAVVSAVIALVIVAGVTYDNTGDSEPASGGSTSALNADEAASDAAVQPMAGVEEQSAPPATGSDTTSQAPPKRFASGVPVAPGEDRAVLHNATLTLSTTPGNVETVTDRVIGVVDRLGGFVQSSTVSSRGNTASAELSVKIPAARLEAGLAQLSKLAHVKERSQQAQDMTDQRALLEARVRDARADREGLRARLAKATTDRERSRLRAALDRATRRVTQRTRRVAELNNAVAYATVDLSVVGDRRSGAAPPGGRWTPGDAVGDAVRVLEVTAGVLVIALAVLLPIVAIAALGALMGRLFVRRRRERALEMA